MAADEHGDLRFADPPGGDALDQLGELARVGLEPAPVQTEKGEHRHESGPLIAVHEGVVLDEVEEVRGGHLKDLPVEEFPPEGRLRSGERRFEQPDVADTRPPSVPRDLVRVQGEHLVERQEDDAHDSASRLNTSPYCRCASATSFLSLAVRRRSRTGETMMTSPSVDTSNGVFASIW